SRLRYAGRDRCGDGRGHGHPGIAAPTEKNRYHARIRGAAQAGPQAQEGSAMNTVIFRTLAPLIVAIMLVFSVYVCLRGHNEPGGGFIGGLIAAASIAVFGMASGVAAV